MREEFVVGVNRLQRNEIELVGNPPTLKLSLDGLRRREGVARAEALKLGVTQVAKVIWVHQNHLLQAVGAKMSCNY